MSLARGTRISLARPTRRNLDSTAVTEAVERPRAVVLAVQLSGVTEEEHESSMIELERLATTLGLDPIARVTQRRAGLASAGVVGTGKLKELAAHTGGPGEIPTGAKRKKTRLDAKREAAEKDDEDESEDDEPDVEDASAMAPKEQKATIVLVDHDLTPSQLRNLERATEAEVLDRTSVILSIFQRHARTREAKLQVEIAQLNYQAPRLREQGAGQDRQRGGIGGKGAGESAIELDRRKIRDRIAELRAELDGIERDSVTRRRRRAEHSTVALVGYTNAGKSSLMRALTGTEQYVADKLFATLDTTVRVLKPETKPRILVSDTVGFIKKLPHDLVASFRSTLDAAREASLLLHIVDAADPAFRTQHAVTREVLGQIGAGDLPAQLVLNKCDRLSPTELDGLRVEFPEAWLVSAKRSEDVARLHDLIVAFFEREMVDAELLVPYRASRLVHQVHEACRVLGEDHEPEGTRLRVRAAPETIELLRAQLPD